MAERQRPTSPHLQIYKWQVQMLTSIVHRATGIALAVGTLVILWGLLALASGPDAYTQFKKVAGHPVGLILLAAWSWALFYHLCNGIRHLVQDAGIGYEVDQFKRSSWLSIIVSVLLLVIVWGFVLTHGGAA